MAEISIIITAFNSEESIECSMRSALNQTFSDIEVIVVDDASTDDTYRAASSLARVDKRVSILSIECNSQCVMARRRGVEASSGRYILFLDSDDTLLPETCAKLYKRMGETPVDILHFGVQVQSSSKKSARATEKYLAPYPGILQGRGVVFKACFVDNKFKWNLVNKMFDSSLCKKAVKLVPQRVVQRGEDLLLFAFLAYHATSYRGLTDSDYYQYNFGSGQDGDDVISLAAFSSLCDSYIVADEIDRMLVEWNAPDNWLGGFRRIKNDLIDNCVHKFRTVLDEKSKLPAAQLLCEKWGWQEALAAFARGYWAKQGTFAKLVQNSILMQGQPVPVKHIGTYYYSYQGGGAEGVLRHLLRLWMKMGYRVTLFLDSEPTGEFILPSGVDVVILPATSKTTSENYLTRLKVLSKEISQRRIDTVVYQAWQNKLMLWDMLTAKAAGANFIIHSHGLFTSKLRVCDDYFSQMPYVYALADAIVSLSATDKLFWDNFNSNVFLTENPLSLDPNLVKPVVCSGKKVLWLGRIAPEKHPEEALKIFEVIHHVDPTVRFCLAGGASTKCYEDKIRNMAYELGLDDVLEMPGWCIGDEKIAAFHNARVFLITSEATEGYPLALAESKVAGVPCVMYDLPYLTMVENPRGIDVVPQGAIAFAAQALLRVLEDDEYYQNMASEARESIGSVASFDFETFWKTVFFAAETRSDPPNSSDKLLWECVTEAYSVGVARVRSTSSARQKQIQVRDARIKELEGKIKKFKESNSWRTGRFVTYLPRKVKKKILPLFINSD